MMSNNRRNIALNVIVRTGHGIVLIRHTESDWLLPGGVIKQGETTRSACSRIMSEQTDLNIRGGHLVGLYDDPNRNESGTISAAYRYRMTSPQEPEPLAVEDVRVEPIDSISSMTLGLDHATMIEDAIAAQKKE